MSTTVQDTGTPQIVPPPADQVPPPTGPDTAGVAAVVRKMEQLQDDARAHELLKNNDGLACFDYLYTIITKHIYKSIVGADLTPDDPRFLDRAFMAKFDMAFADRFFNAVGRGAEQDWQPKCWKILLDHREDPHISPLVFAIAGVNAHVNFDLPFALVTACVQQKKELDSGHNHEDYTRINDFFKLHMTQLRQHFESELERELDKSLLCEVETWLGDLVVALARAVAWNAAVKLWRVHEDEAKMTKKAKSRDRWVAAATWGLFALDRMPYMAFDAMSVVPGPHRRMAAKGLACLGREPKHQKAKPSA